MERTAANGIEREWLNAEELRDANRISPGSAAFLCRPAALSVSRSDGGDGKNLPGQRRRDYYNAEVSALSEHKNGVVIRTRRAVNMKHRR